MPLTVILLSKQNEFNEALGSLSLLNPQNIIVGVYQPLRIPNVRTVVVQGSYAKSLDQLVDLAETDWIFYLKENERLLQINENLTDIWNEDNIYGVQILQNEVLIKEPRIWNKKNHKIIFKNPVFERPNANITKVLDILLYQTTEKSLDKELEVWRRSHPLSIDACYYKAFSCLAKRNFKEFKSLITNYLFGTTKNEISTVMARYYLALVQGIVYNDIQEAIHNLILCLEQNILMAEFWCLLGDIFTKNGEFEKAILFYENATLLGNHRSKFDIWPMEISKYEAYPKEMIQKCRAALPQLKSYRI